MRNGLATLGAVIVLPLVAVALVRIVGGFFLRRSPERLAVLQRHWLWSIVPLTAVYLAVIDAWWFAIVWLGVSILAVVLLKRWNYMGMAAHDN